MAMACDSEEADSPTVKQRVIPTEADFIYLGSEVPGKMIFGLNESYVCVRVCVWGRGCVCVCECVWRALLRILYRTQIFFVE